MKFSKHIEHLVDVDDEDDDDEDRAELVEELGDKSGDVLSGEFELALVGWRYLITGKRAIDAKLSPHASGDDDDGDDV